MTTDDSAQADGDAMSRFIARLRQGDPQAAEELWKQYVERLLKLARARLRGFPTSSLDEEDIVISVFDRFYRAAQNGRFAKLADRDDLWQILVLLTERKIADQYRSAIAF